MLAVAAHNIFRDWATYATTGGALVLLYGTIWARVIRPSRVAHKQREAEKDREHTEHNADLARLKDVPERLGLIEWWIAVHEKADCA